MDIAFVVDKIRTAVGDLLALRVRPYGGALTTPFLHFGAIVNLDPAGAETALTDWLPCQAAPLIGCAYVENFGANPIVSVRVEACIDPITAPAAFDVVVDATAIPIGKGRAYALTNNAAATGEAFAAAPLPWYRIHGTAAVGGAKGRASIVGKGA